MIAIRPRRRRQAGLLLTALAGVVLAGAASAHGDKTPSKAAPPEQEVEQQAEEDHFNGVQLALPVMDSARGRKLFVSKGCVTCHAINGVGGHDAPNLDAHTMQAWMNPFDFAAKMWRGAAAMIATQEEALGAQIEFTGQELADIIAFVHDDEAQHDFTEADIPPEIAKLMNHTHGHKPAHQQEIGHQHSEEGGHHNESSGHHN